MIEEFFKSIWNKVVAVLFLLSAILQIAALAFPEFLDTTIKWLSFSSFIGLGLYIILQFTWEISRKLKNIDFTLQQLSTHLSEFPNFLTISLELLSQLEESLKQLVLQFDYIETQLQASFSRVTQATEKVELLSQDTDKIQASHAYEYFAERYGMGNKHIEVEWAISSDGSAILTRHIEIEAYSVIDTIETYLAIPEQSSSGEKRSVDFLDIEPLGSNRVFEIRTVEKDRRLAVSLSLNNPLIKGETFGYRMQEKLSSNLYSINLTRSEQQKRTDSRFDYVGWNINLPTRTAKLKVFFPEGFKPLEPFAQVRYASSAGFPVERTQAEETSRLGNQLKVEGPTGGRYTLSLEVEYPIAGFIYLVGWRPQTKERASTSSDIAHPDTPNLTQNYLSTIRNILIERFSEGELQALIMDLDIDYEVLPSKDKANLARELVAYLDRRNQIQKLVEAAKAQRPDITWPSKRN